MKCPFCGQEMESGYVSGDMNRTMGCGLYWNFYKYTEKPLLSQLFSNEKKEFAMEKRSIHLNSKLGSLYYGVTAYKCRDCEKIIMDTYVENDFYDDYEGDEEDADYEFPDI